MSYPRPFNKEVGGCYVCAREELVETPAMFLLDPIILRIKQPLYFSYSGWLISITNSSQWTVLKSSRENGWKFRPRPEEEASSVNRRLRDGWFASVTTGNPRCPQVDSFLSSSPSRGLCCCQSISQPPGNIQQHFPPNFIFRTVLNQLNAPNHGNSNHHRNF